MIHKIIWTDNASTLQKNMNRQHAGIRGREVTSKRKFFFTCFYINLNSPREGGYEPPFHF